MLFSMKKIIGYVFLAGFVGTQANQSPTIEDFKKRIDITVSEQLFIVPTPSERAKEEALKRSMEARMARIQREASRQSVEAQTARREKIYGGK